MREKESAAEDYDLVPVSVSRNECNYDLSYVYIRNGEIHAIWLLKRPCNRTTLRKYI